MIERPPAREIWEPLPGCWRHRRAGVVIAWCACCGRQGVADNIVHLRKGWEGNRRVMQGRCYKHFQRNPCAIAGCTRTTDATKVGWALDQWLCSTHWRAYVPPRSPERRAYQRIWRLAKRRGWDAALERRYHRLWRAIVLRARRRDGTGHLDIAEIERFLASL